MPGYQRLWHINTHAVNPASPGNMTCQRRDCSKTKTSGMSPQGVVILLVRSYKLNSVCNAEPISHTGVSELCNDQAGAGFYGRPVPCTCMTPSTMLWNCQCTFLWHFFFNDLYNNKTGWKSDNSARFVNFLFSWILYIVLEYWLLPYPINLPVFRHQKSRNDSLIFLMSINSYEPVSFLL